MKQLYLGIVLLALTANSYSQIVVRADVSHLFGSTSYRFDALTYSPSNPDDVYPIAQKGHTGSFLVKPEP